MRFAAAVILVGAVVGAGCGGGSEDDDTDGDTDHVSGDASTDDAGDAGDAGDAPDGMLPDALPDANVPMGYHSIATANQFSCELDPDGVAKCWGLIGNSVSQTQYLTPHSYGTTVHFKQLSAGGENVCGTSTDDLGYCWGPNGDAQLGTGAVNDGFVVPTLVGTGRPFSQLFAGGVTACGINTESVGFCWGVTRYGQVGADITSPNGVHSPIMVQGPPGMTMKFTDMDVSADFACGITPGHVAFCWGSNYEGQLGIGGAIPHAHPGTDKNIATAVSTAQSWSRVVTGDDFACGLTTAGAAYCWGNGAGYQLGTGTTASSSVPVAVAGGHTFSDIDAGADWVCGTSTTTGELWCWGASTLGQAATTTDPLTTPTHVATSLTFSEISASDGQHACGASLDHMKVYCWGRNEQGQLGNGTTSPATTANATPVEVTQ